MGDSVKTKNEIAHRLSRQKKKHVHELVCGILLGHLQLVSEAVASLDVITSRAFRLNGALIECCVHFLLENGFGRF